jgi:hypothetical protein
MREIIFTLIALIAINITNGQEIHKCDSTRSLLIFSKDKSSFVVKINGKVNQTDRESVFSVGEYSLQYLVVDKVNYLDSAKDNSELSILSRYAMKEAEYFTGLFERKLNITMQKLSLTSNQIGLIWYFDYPTEKLNMQPKETSTEKIIVTKSLLFINLIIGDKIIGLASTQFSDQKFENVKTFLVNIANTVKPIGNNVDFDNLCNY